MPSNAYIASDGATVMKVGKTNNFTKRMQQIGLPMTAIISCPDEMTAFLIERELRRIAIEMGGKRHPTKVDWFEYDSDIYWMLQAFAESLNGLTPASIDGLPNEEIVLRRKQYVRQLREMQHNLIKDYLAQRENQENEISALKRKVAYLKEDIQQQRKEFRKELEEQHEKHGNLIREMGRWEGQLARFKKSVKEEGQQTIDTERLLDFLNSLVQGDIE